MKLQRTYRALFALLLLAATLLAASPAFARTRLPAGGETPAEREASQYAAAELAAAPPHGNLPDDSLPPDKLATAQHLDHLRLTLGLTGSLWALLQLPLLLHFRLAARMRDLTLRVGARLRPRHPVVALFAESFTFSALLFTLTELLELPLALIGHHLSLAYGLSIEAWGPWSIDLLKGLGLTIAGGGLLFALLIFLLRRLPHRWWLATWALLLPIMLFVLWAEPVYLEPIFNHFQPLAESDPALTARLEKVARQAGIDIPADHMFLMRASEKTRTLNAYVTGVGSTKRLVLWDTTIHRLTPDQTLVIFGHEAGHYVLGHVLLGTILGFVSLFAGLWITHRLLNWALRRFGPRWRIASQGDWAAVIVLMLVSDLLSTVTAPVANTVSRQAEHAADVFGQEAVHGIVADPQEAARSSFAVLSETSLEVPKPNRLLEFWTGTHPATGRRAAFATAYNPWRAGYAPKYFPR